MLQKADVILGIDLIIILYLWCSFLLLKSWSILISISMGVWETKATLIFLLCYYSHLFQFWGGGNLEGVLFQRRCPLDRGCTKGELGGNGPHFFQKIMFFVCRIYTLNPKLM